LNDRVLIADDDEGVLWVLEKFFSDKGIETVKAADGISASALLKQGGIGLAVVDINMPGRSGLEVLGESGGEAGMPSFIIMTAESTMEKTLEAMKLGAFDYITKPFDLAELDIIVERAIENAALRKKLDSLSARLAEKLAGETVFVGRSRAVQEVFKTIGRVARRDVTVLVTGESGTGKELVSRLLHMNSTRSDGPFVAVNSAAVPRELMESELFGHEKGAFTGAVETKAGKFELADGGTLFLDEVGDMTAGLQARLLRVIQEREFFRVGGREPVRVDVRIVAATNQDLDAAVAEKRFREDLLFRLNGVTIHLPPLRERKGDVALLADYFLERFRAEFGLEPKTFSEGACKALEGYAWPGNVRELENVVRRAVLLGPGVVITVEDLDLPRARNRKESIEDIIAAKLKPFIDRTCDKGNQDLYDFIMPFMERPLIRLVLEKTRGNQVQAAEVLGINRNTLRKKIKELKINLKKLKE